jgi:hypothetical protein
VSGTTSEYVRTGDQVARFAVRFCPVSGITA